jgi:hypothetical protein
VANALQGGLFAYQQITQPVLPEPPAPIVSTDWNVERIPYIIQPPSRQYAIQGAAMSFQAPVRLLPFPSFTAGAFAPEVPWAALALLYKPSAVARNTSGEVRPLFPQPTTAATVFIAGLLGDYPWGVLDYRRDLSAVMTTARGSQYKGLLSVPVNQFGWDTVQVLLPNRYASIIPAILGVVNSAAPIFPLPATVVIPLMSSWFQEWCPQIQPVGRLVALAIAQAQTAPVFPQPFISGPVPFVTSYFQEWFPQFQQVGRYFPAIGARNETVQPIFPPAFEPPPPPVCAGMPLGDGTGNATDSVFRDNAGNPIAVLLCRICQSGKPLLVRGDFAIWCQDCCRFVSREDTVMSTTRAPKFFRGVF